MKKFLTELNQEVGVRGSMVVTLDGMVVAADLGVGLQEELVAAIASSAIQQVRRAIAGVGYQDLTRFILQSAHGKLVFVDIGVGYLVVVLDKRLNMDLTLIAISGAAYRIRNVTRLPK
mgnify:CR=1 FL=1